ncbi:hypothetical protein CCP3SC15_2450007 [Gammaproteobacteria bacterium]
MAIELAKLCHSYDRDIQAAAIITRIVFYHIEDAMIMDQVRKYFVAWAWSKLDLNL